MDLIQFNLAFFIILGIVFCLLATARYYLYRKTKTFFSAFKSVKVIFLTVILTPIFSVLWTFTSMFYSLETSSKNKYSDNLAYLTKMVLLSDTAIYEDIGKPNYIGKLTNSLIFKQKDTLTPIADFQKGGGMTGDNYYAFSAKGKTYWIAGKNLMAKFEYVYFFQPLEITVANKSALDKQKVAEIWGRAKKYMKIYGNHHKNDTPEDNISNDSLLLKRYDYAVGGNFLQIKKTENAQEVKFKVDAPTYKGSEKTCVKSVEDKFKNKPANANACAYYMQHGFFYKDELLGKK